VAATFVTQDERKCKLQGLSWRVDGLIKYFYTRKRYVRTMLKIVNLELQLQDSHEDCAEPVARVPSSLTIKGTSR